MNKEKQEIKQIINEIDTIMFGEKYKRNIEEDYENVMALAAMGGTVGIGISFVAGYTDSKWLIPPLVTALIGAGTGCILNMRNMKSVYKDYELAYLSLSREEQIEVLNLSKKLFLVYKKEMQTNKNKKIINKYLQIKNEDTMCENTMFDEFESNHPQFKLLTEEEIENIHKKGKLASTEKFYEWSRLNYCPASDGYDVRCKDYETCRDCTVAWVNEKDEWDSMKTIPIEAVYSLEDDYEQLFFKKSKEYIKTKNV